MECGEWCAWVCFKACENCVFGELDERAEIVICAMGETFDEEVTKQIFLRHNASGGDIFA